MIEARQYPDMSRPLGSRGRAWIAECVVDGTSYSARSYSGASYALARALVAAGVADQPITMTVHGLLGSQTHRSIYGLAEWAISEGASVGIHRTRWEPYRPSEDASTE
jgi:hypothetical protein